MASPLRLAVLTGGGDCPGLNAVIRGVVREALRGGDSVLGFRDGWRGPLEGDYEELTRESVRGILPLGGTILGSSRTNPLKIEGGVERIAQRFQELSLDGLLVIGGDDTLGVADHLYKEHGVPVLGLPKTIDNDLSGTDRTFGFDTAVQIAVDAIDRVHSTAASHHRNMIVEVMGRYAGHIALHAGVAGGADLILIPERPFDIEEVCAAVRRRHQEGAGSTVIVVAEGAAAKEGRFSLSDQGQDSFGHSRLGGIGMALERAIEDATGYETRAVVLGHLQRGGTPTAFDRVLATRCGLAAVRAAREGRWGEMIALRGNELQSVPLSIAVGKLRLVSDEEYEEVAPLLA